MKHHPVTMSWWCGAGSTAWRSRRCARSARTAWPTQASTGSVFAVLDGDVQRLCERVPRLRSPGTIWVATCHELRRRGFDLLATDARPHFDIVLPDLEPGTIEALVACFTAIENPAKQGRG